MNIVRHILLPTLVLLAFVPALAGPAVSLHARLSGQSNAALDWTVAGKFKHVTLLRTASPIEEEDLHKPRYPVALVGLVDQARGNLVDEGVADGVTYHYWLEVERDGGRFEYAETDLDLPERPLPASIGHLSLYVDKTQFYLEARDAGERIKRYPVALGVDPVGRKLFQDNRRTPEGVYHVVALQPKAAYHRAIDLDYPNAFDRARYATATELGMVPPGREIGGDIQIHGDTLDEVAVFANWTHGCIAMRNQDIDELMARPELEKGVFVFILGQNLTEADLLSILSPWTSKEILAFSATLEKLRIAPGDGNGTLDKGFMRALGAYQHLRGLPFTCELDARTVKALRAEP